MSINEDVKTILSSFYTYCSLGNVVSSNSELNMKQSVLRSFGSSRLKANVHTSDANCCDVSTVCIFVLKKGVTYGCYFRYVDLKSYTNV